MVWMYFLPTLHTKDCFNYDNFPEFRNSHVNLMNKLKKSTTHTKQNFRKTYVIGDRFFYFEKFNSEYCYVLCLDLKLKENEKSLKLKYLETSFN